MRIDFELSGHCSLYLLRPVTRAAHAWVEVGQEMIVGGAAAQGFSRIAEFGQEPA